MLAGMAPLGLLVAAAALLFAPCCLAAQTTAIDLHSALGSASACAVSSGIQFLTENELIVLAGPNPNCYAVDGLEVVAISLDGRVMARRPWNSSEMGIVLRPGRLVVPEPGGVTILDDSLRPVQTLRFGNRKKTPEVAATDTGTLTLTVGRQSRSYFGTPLKEIETPREGPKLDPAQIISAGDGSWQLSYSGNSLVATPRGGQPRVIADLSWVNPICENRELCKTDALHFQAVLGRKKRVMVTSLGTKVPVTLSFGLVSYFRAEVFDLDTGDEVYREEDFFRPKQRIAGLSPEGDRLVISDGTSAYLHLLN